MYIGSSQSGNVYNHLMVSVLTNTHVAITSHYMDSGADKVHFDAYQMVKNSAHSTSIFIVIIVLCSPINRSIDSEVRFETIGTVHGLYSAVPKTITSIGNAFNVVQMLGPRTTVSWQGTYQDDGHEWCLHASLFILGIGNALPFIEEAS
jgi:hypothetical protein